MASSLTMEGIIRSRRHRGTTLLHKHAAAKEGPGTWRKVCRYASVVG